MFYNKKKFKVKITGRAGLIYQENGKAIEIDSEMLVGPEYDIVIYAKSIKEWNDGKSVSGDEKNRILQNLKDHFNKNKYKVDIV